MDGLFTCHVVGWKRIPPNWIRDKLFPFFNKQRAKHFQRNLCLQDNFYPIRKR